jgi:hypothetical protein
MNGHARDLAQRSRPEIGRQYILRQEEEPSPQITRRGEATQATQVEESPGAYATIIAEQPTTIAHLTVGEAVMQLDLSDQMVLMFRNSASGEINVVYRRSDGHIGWLDPSGGS